MITSIALTGTVPPVVTYRNLISKIFGYLRLHPGWDNDGGIAPQTKTAMNAIKYLADISGSAPPPRMYVVGDGEIGFSWESPAGYAQIGFHDDDEIVVIARSADGQRDVRGVYNSLAELPDVLIQIFSLKANDV